jgi:flagellar biosynthesis protein FlhG
MSDQAADLRALVGVSDDIEVKDTRVIAVTSGKGGVGKSTLVANLGVHYARQGLNVIVVDGDLGLANLDLLLNLDPPYTLNHVIEGQKTLEEIIVTGPYGLRIIPGASGLSGLANLEPTAMQRLLLEIARVGATADLMIIDTSAGIGQHVIHFAVAASEILIVATPEPTSITDAYAIIKVIWQQSSDAAFNLIINRARTREAAESASLQLRSVARRFLKVDIQDLGHLPDDDNVGRAVRSQEPLVLAHPGTPASRALEAVAARILDQPLDPDREPGILSFVRRLAGQRARA